ncbi:unnamed protein product [Protopolystoma xenopodis]|uniref:Uncharacterized protein n=1 Tax=Protopolystoma xenopodis TaxID=117903 RepID=A0A3S5CPM7_9PLAT|nr:unnamed protein product [Protopolystoma xenopodis]
MNLVSRPTRSAGLRIPNLSCFIRAPQDHTQPAHSCGIDDAPVGKAAEVAFARKA